MVVGRRRSRQTRRGSSSDADQEGANRVNDNFPVRKADL